MAVTCLDLFSSTGVVNVGSVYGFESYGTGLTATATGAGFICGRACGVFPFSVCRLRRPASRPTGGDAARICLQR